LLGNVTGNMEQRDNKENCKIDANIDNKCDWQIERKNNAKMKVTNRWQ
jgi:hypothetical protein